MLIGCFTGIAADRRPSVPNAMERATGSLKQKQQRSEIICN